MNDLLFAVCMKSRNKEHFIKLLDDIISPTERVMIIKRLSVIYLLLREVPTGEIVEHLRVSKSTVSKFSLLFHDRKTPLIETVEILISQKKILHAIDDLFASIFIQPGRKIGHWQLYWDQVRKQQNPLR